MRRTLLLCLLLFFAAPAVHATLFGTVRGIVHDPQHRPIQDAAVVLKSKTSDYSHTATSDASGEFEFDAVPLGDYTVTVSVALFDTQEQAVTVLSGTAPVLHFPMKLAAQNASVTVSAGSPAVETGSVTPTTLVDRNELNRTPGAERTNSLAIITDYVPGAYVTHDQLHIRGGHQVSWLVDGVLIPNTNIASNVGPQIDPKDIDAIEMQRGSYGADLGDRTYGIFDVSPRTGFESNRQAQLVASFGNFFETNDQLSFASHTQRFAYYASLTGNRSDYGLQTPVSQILHDQENGMGGFGSLIFNLDPEDQFRLVASSRRDFYQIPVNPADVASGTILKDAEIEKDSFVNFSWVRTFRRGVLLTVSPLYHFNSADYESDRNDLPTATTDERGSNYAGGQATLGVVAGRHNAQAGFYGFWQRDNQLFAVVPALSPEREIPTGSLQAAWAEDQFRAAEWLTLTAGVRQTHFSGSVVENATSPRAGVSLKIPRLHWVFRGFYGDFYQAPPLITFSGPLLQFVSGQNLFPIPLHGERDEEQQFGVTIPLQGWIFDADTFRTHVHNFFDHNNVNGSNIFFPLTIDGALIRGWELTIHSPRLFGRGQAFLTYSNQVAQGRGAISGGLTDFSPPPQGFFLLDHDQRNTLNTGGNWALPWRSSASATVAYGSGFSDGDNPGSHLPGHTTLDLSVAKDFGESVSLSVTGLNVANRRLLVDNSLTFGGLHWIDPRQIYVQLRYRFHY